MSACTSLNKKNSYHILIDDNVRADKYCTPLQLPFQFYPHLVHSDWVKPHQTSNNFHCAYPFPPQLFLSLIFFSNFCFNIKTLSCIIAKNQRKTKRVRPTEGSGGCQIKNVSISRSTVFLINHVLRLSCLNRLRP